MLAKLVKCVECGEDYPLSDLCPNNLCPKCQPTTDKTTVETAIRLWTPILEKLYWQGRRNSNVPVTSIGVYGEIQMLLSLLTPIFAAKIEAERERIVAILVKNKTDWFGDEDNPDWVQVVQFHDISDWLAVKNQPLQEKEDAK